MWNYEKRLQYPVKISQTNPKIAQVIISQFGGPDGELAASMRYLSQRYTMPYKEVTGILTDIGTEELAHMEIVSAIVYQLTRDLSLDEIKASGFDKYFVDHTLALWPQSAGGTPMDRFGEPKELVGAMLYLCDHTASGFVTGVILPVDGGFSAYCGV